MAANSGNSRGNELAEWPTSMGEWMHNAHSANSYSKSKPNYVTFPYPYPDNDSDITPYAKAKFTYVHTALDATPESVTDHWYGDMDVADTSDSSNNSGRVDEQEIV